SQSGKGIAQPVFWRDFLNSALLRLAVDALHVPAVGLQPVALGIAECGLADDAMRAEIQQILLLLNKHAHDAAGARWQEHFAGHGKRHEFFIAEDVRLADGAVAIESRVFLPERVAARMTRIRLEGRRAPAGSLVNG